MKKYSNIFMIILCVFLLCGCEKFEDGHGNDRNKDVNATTIKTTLKSVKEQAPGCYATYEDYINTYAEMTYADIKRLVGCDGVLQTEAIINGQKHQSYYWYGKYNDQVLSVSFVDGVVNGYNHSNLDRGVDTSKYEKTTKKVEIDPDGPLTDAERKALGIE